MQPVPADMMAQSAAAATFEDLVPLDIVLKRNKESPTDQTYIVPAAPLAARDAVAIAARLSTHRALPTARYGSGSNWGYLGDMPSEVQMGPRAAMPIIKTLSDELESARGQFQSASLPSFNISVPGRYLQMATHVQTQIMAQSNVMMPDPDYDSEEEEELEMELELDEMGLDELQEIVDDAGSDDKMKIAAARRLGAIRKRQTLTEALEDADDVAKINILQQLSALTDQQERQERQERLARKQKEERWTSRHTKMRRGLLFDINDSGTFRATDFRPKFLRKAQSTALQLAQSMAVYSNTVLPSVLLSGGHMTMVQSRQILPPAPMGVPGILDVLQKMKMTPESLKHMIGHRGGRQVKRYLRGGRCGVARCPICNFQYSQTSSYMFGASSGVAPHAGNVVMLSQNDMSFPVAGHAQYGNFLSYIDASVPGNLADTMAFMGRVVDLIANEEKSRLASLNDYDMDMDDQIFAIWSVYKDAIDELNKPDASMIAVAHSLKALSGMIEFLQMKHLRGNSLEDLDPVNPMESLDASIAQAVNEKIDAEMARLAKMVDMWRQDMKQKAVRDVVGPKESELRSNVSSAHLQEPVAATVDFSDHILPPIPAGSKLRPLSGQPPKIKLIVRAPAPAPAPAPIMVAADDDDDDDDDEMGGAAPSPSPLPPPLPAVASIAGDIVADTTTVAPTPLMTFMENQLMLSRNPDLHGAISIAYQYLAHAEAAPETSDFLDTAQEIIMDQMEREVARRSTRETAEQAKIANDVTNTIEDPEFAREFAQDLGRYESYQELQNMLGHAAGVLALAKIKQDRTATSKPRAGAGADDADDATSRRYRSQFILGYMLRRAFFTSRDMEDGIGMMMARSIAKLLYEEMEAKPAPEFVLSQLPTEPINKNIARAKERLAVSWSDLHICFRLYIFWNLRHLAPFSIIHNADHYPARATVVKDMAQKLKEDKERAKTTGRPAQLKKGEIVEKMEMEQMDVHNFIVMTLITWELLRVSTVSAYLSSPMIYVLRSLNVFRDAFLAETGTMPSFPTELVPDDTNGVGIVMRTAPEFVAFANDTLRMFEEEVRNHMSKSGTGKESTKSVSAKPLAVNKTMKILLENVLDDPRKLPGVSGRFQPIGPRLVDDFELSSPSFKLTKIHRTPAGEVELQHPLMLTADTYHTPDLTVLTVVQNLQQADAEDAVVESQRQREARLGTAQMPISDAMPGMVMRPMNSGSSGAKADMRGVQQMQMQAGRNLHQCQTLYEEQLTECNRDALTSAMMLAAEQRKNQKSSAGAVSDVGAVSDPDPILVNTFYLDREEEMKARSTEAQIAEAEERLAKLANTRSQLEECQAASAEVTKLMIKATIAMYSTNADVSTVINCCKLDPETSIVETLPWNQDLPKIAEYHFDTDKPGQMMQSCVSVPTLVWEGLACPPRMLEMVSRICEPLDTILGGPPQTYLVDEAWQTALVTARVTMHSRMALGVDFSGPRYVMVVYIKQDPRTLDLPPPMGRVILTDYPAGAIIPASQLFVPNVPFVDVTQMALMNTDSFEELKDLPIAVTQFRGGWSRGVPSAGAPVFILHKAKSNGVPVSFCNSAIHLGAPPTEAWVGTAPEYSMVPCTECKVELDACYHCLKRVGHGEHVQFLPATGLLACDNCLSKYSNAQFVGDYEDVYCDYPGCTRIGMRNPVLNLTRCTKHAVAIPLREMPVDSDEYLLDGITTRRRPRELIGQAMTGYTTMSAMVKAQAQRHQMMMEGHPHQYETDVFTTLPPGAPHMSLLRSVIPPAGFESLAGTVLNLEMEVEEVKLPNPGYSQFWQERMHIIGGGTGDDKSLLRKLMNRLRIAPVSGTNLAMYPSEKDLKSFSGPAYAGRALPADAADVTLDQLKELEKASETIDLKVLRDDSEAALAADAFEDRSAEYFLKQRYPPMFIQSPLPMGKVGYNPLHPFDAAWDDAWALMDDTTTRQIVSAAEPSCRVFTYTWVPGLQAEDAPGPTVAVESDALERVNMTSVFKLEDTAEWVWAWNPETKCMTQFAQVPVAEPVAPAPAEDEDLDGTSIEGIPTPSALVYPSVVTPDLPDLPSKDVNSLHSHWDRYLPDYDVTGLNLEEKVLVYEHQGLTLMQACIVDMNHPSGLYTSGKFMIRGMGLYQRLMRADTLKQLPDTLDFKIQFWNIDTMGRCSVQRVACLTTVSTGTLNLYTPQTQFYAPPQPLFVGAAPPLPAGHARPAFGAPVWSSPITTTTLRDLLATARKMSVAKFDPAHTGSYMRVLTAEPQIIQPEIIKIQKINADRPEGKEPADTSNVCSAMLFDYTGVSVPYFQQRGDRHIRAPNPNPGANQTFAQYMKTAVSPFALVYPKTPIISPTIISNSQPPMLKLGTPPGNSSSVWTTELQQWTKQLSMIQGPELTPQQLALPALTRDLLYNMASPVPINMKQCSQMLARAMVLAPYSMPLVSVDEMAQMFGVEVEPQGHVSYAQRVGGDLMLTRPKDELDTMARVIAAGPGSGNIQKLLRSSAALSLRITKMNAQLVQTILQPGAGTGSKLRLSFEVPANGTAMHLPIAAATAAGESHALAIVAAGAGPIATNPFSHIYRPRRLFINAKGRAARDFSKGRRAEPPLSLVSVTMRVLDLDPETDGTRRLHIPEAEPSAGSVFRKPLRFFVPGWVGSEPPLEYMVPESTEVKLVSSIYGMDLTMTLDRAQKVLYADVDMKQLLRSILDLRFPRFFRERGVGKCHFVALKPDIGSHEFVGTAGRNCKICRKKEESNIHSKASSLAPQLPLGSKAQTGRQDVLLQDQHIHCCHGRKPFKTMAEFWTLHRHAFSSTGTGPTAVCAHCGKVENQSQHSHPYMPAQSSSISCGYCGKPASHSCHGMFEAFFEPKPDASPANNYRMIQQLMANGMLARLARDATSEQRAQAATISMVTGNFPERSLAEIGKVLYASTAAPIRLVGYENNRMVSLPVAGANILDDGSVNLLWKPRSVPYFDLPQSALSKRRLSARRGLGPIIPIPDSPATMLTVWNGRAAPVYDEMQLVRNTSSEIDSKLFIQAGSTLVNQFKLENAGIDAEIEDAEELLLRSRVLLDLLMERLADDQTLMAEADRRNAEVKTQRVAEAAAKHKARQPLMKGRGRDEDESNAKKRRAGGAGAMGTPIPVAADDDDDSGSDLDFDLDAEFDRLGGTTLPAALPTALPPVSPMVVPSAMSPLAPLAGDVMTMPSKLPPAETFVFPEPATVPAPVSIAVSSPVPAPAPLVAGIIDSDEEDDDDDEEEERQISIVGAAAVPQRRATYAEMTSGYNPAAMERINQINRGEGPEPSIDELGTIIQGWRDVYMTEETFLNDYGPEYLVAYRKLQPLIDAEDKAKRDAEFAAEWEKADLKRRHYAIEAIRTGPARAKKKARINRTRKRIARVQARVEELELELANKTRTRKVLSNNWAILLLLRQRLYAGTCTMAATRLLLRAFEYEASNNGDYRSLFTAPELQSLFGTGDGLLEDTGPLSRTVLLRSVLSAIMEKVWDTFSAKAIAQHSIDQFKDVLLLHMGIMDRFAAEFISIDDLVRNLVHLSIVLTTLGSDLPDQLLAEPRYMPMIGSRLGAELSIALTDVKAQAANLNTLDANSVKLLRETLLRGSSAVDTGLQYGGSLITKALEEAQKTAQYRGGLITKALEEAKMARKAELRAKKAVEAEKQAKAQAERTRRANVAQAMKSRSATRRASTPTAAKAPAAKAKAKTTRKLSSVKARKALAAKKSKAKAKAKRPPAPASFTNQDLMDETI